VPWGTRHHEIFAGRFNHGITVAAVCEDLPEEHNSVTLDQTLTDSDSIPSPMVTYRIGANTNKMLDHATAKATELMDAAGAREIIVARVPRLRGWHQMGTARMGNDPQQSVVNRWGMAHDVPNLFLVDGSVLVTGSGVNPTSTIQAIALRTADYINQRHREL
jgi:choline dehydrogenase-like flavoprotein